jgi:hypothetical protein
MYVGQRREGSLADEESVEIKCGRAGRESRARLLRFSGEGVGGRVQGCGLGVGESAHGPGERGVMLAVRSECLSFFDLSSASLRVSCDPLRVSSAGLRVSCDPLRVRDRLCSNLGQLVTASEFR